MHSPGWKILVSEHMAARLFTALLLASCLLGRIYAQEPAAPLPPQVHPWGLFEPGAWKMVRVITEIFNDQGAVAGSSVSDSKTTLIDANDDSVLLEMKVTVEVAGKRFDTEPQTVRQGFHGDQQSPALIIKEPSSGEVTIEDRKIPCLVRQIESTSASGKTVTTLYYSDKVPPYVLKRESVTTDLSSKHILSETSLTVLALDMPCKILGCQRSSANVKTIQKTPRGTIVTMAVICPDIPGGVVSHTSKELNSAGRPVRRSTLELVDFSTEPEKDRAAVFGRKRPPRSRGK
jgi:hypothetical protein